jgi:hypothetical protein
MPKGRVMFAMAMVLILSRMPSARADAPNLCAKFTAAEAAAMLGTAVEAGELGSLGTSCQWFGKDQKSYAIISVVDTNYFIDPRQAPGYEVAPGIGTRAYSHPENRGPGEQGWTAMALTKSSTVSVVLIGTTAKRANAVAMLKQLVQRQ